MRGALRSLETDFDKRMQARRRMMEHLGLHPTEEEASELFEELRQTLLACAQCGNVERCNLWPGLGTNCLPPFCSGSGAFIALENRMERNAALSASHH